MQVRTVQLHPYTNFKTLHLSGSTQLKPTLFKGQLHFLSAVGNSRLWRADLSYIWIFNCAGGWCPNLPIIQESTVA